MGSGMEAVVLATVAGSEALNWLVLAKCGSGLVTVKLVVLLLLEEVVTLGIVDPATSIVASVKDSISSVRFSWLLDCVAVSGTMVVRTGFVL